MRATDLPTLIDWTRRLTGLDSARLADARQEVESWGFPATQRELVDRMDIDALAGAALLTSSIGGLVERGVPRNKLMSKLKTDPDLWPTWAEICAAEMIARHQDEEVKLDLEAGRSRGSHADFRLTVPSDELGASIEFKAIGLSDDEVDFHARAGALLPRLAPRVGMATVHADVEQELWIPGYAERKRPEEAYAPMRAKMPEHARSLTGGVIVGHFAEQRYLERLKVRLEDAVRQLPDGDACWVAIWWSNGATAEMAKRAFDVADLPSRVEGLILVGSAVAVPDPEVHHYNQILPRGAPADDEGHFYSLEENPLGEVVLERFEISSGVRATLLVEPKTRPRIPLLFRDGARRIFPFNLLVDADPDHARMGFR